MRFFLYPAYSAFSKGNQFLENFSVFFFRSFFFSGTLNLLGFFIIVINHTYFQILLFMIMITCLMQFFSGNSQAAIWCYWTCETEDWAAAGSVDHSWSLWITCGDASASVCMIHELLMIRFCCICRQEYLWIEIHITGLLFTFISYAAFYIGP